MSTALGDGIPHHAPSSLTLGQLFAHRLKQFGDRVAIRHPDGDLSYRSLVDKAEKLAQALMGTGVGPGETVALMMSNCPEYLVADLAVIRCGAVKVALNQMLSSSDVEFILQDSDPTVVIADRHFLELLGPILEDAASIPTVIALDGSQDRWSIPWERFVSDTRSQQAGTSAGPDDLGLLLYTGGTTGRPKGVMHTQHGLAINLLSHTVEMGLAYGDRLLLSSPLPHSAGFLAQAALLCGATILLDERFDPDAMLDRIACGEVTYTFLVPTMIYRLLDRAANRDLSRSELHTILYGAAPITSERLAQGLEIFGPVFMQLYGQSEAPNFLTRLRREDHSPDPALAHRLTSCGQAVLLADVAIVDDDGQICPPGVSGEVVARSPYVMAGYRGLPEITARALQRGWLHTGDIGYLDGDQYLYLLDRKADMIITGGMNVYAAEIEQFLQGCPGVADVAVVGVPDPDWGEAVVAFVVAGPNGVVERDLGERCRAGLAAYKRPKSIQQIGGLPTTALGKVDKKVLRTLAAPAPSAIRNSDQPHHPVTTYRKEAT